MDSGINSIKDMVIIILKEKERQKVIKLSLLLSFIFKNINNEPIDVDKPAINEIIKGPIISIESPSNIMYLLA